MTNGYEYKSGVIIEDGEDLEISTMLSTAEVAYLIGVDGSTIRRWVHADKLHGIKFGDAKTASLRFRAQDIDRFIFERLKKSAAKKKRDAKDEHTTS
jgi:excisionase family DNA binding protein